MSSPPHHSLLLNHKVVIKFVCAFVVTLPLFSAPEQLSVGPDTVVTGTTVLTAAAPIHVSLPHLFKGPVLTESYNMLAVCKLHYGNGRRYGVRICNLSRQLCLFDTHIWMIKHLLSPDTHSLL